MENKAPGTEPRPGGYSAGAGGQTHENFFHPKRKMKLESIQRAGLRSARRVGFWFAVGTMVVVLLPTHLGPLYVEYVAGNEWLQRAKKSIWQRRNEKDYELFMTQRKNAWKEWLGLKQYNISGDTNQGEIQRYRDNSA